METPNLGDSSAPSSTPRESLVPDPPWDLWQVVNPSRASVSPSVEWKQENRSCVGVSTPLWEPLGVPVPDSLAELTGELGGQGMFYDASRLAWVGSGSLRNGRRKSRKGSSYCIGAKICMSQMLAAQNSLEVWAFN